MVRRILHELELDKIAAVDRPCQEAGPVMIKRDQSQDLVWHPDHGLIPRGPNTITKAAEVEKRQSSDAERRHMADTGAAPDFTAQRRGVHAALEALAKVRSGQTGESPEQAYCRLLMAEPGLQRALQ